MCNIGAAAIVATQIVAAIVVAAIIAAAIVAALLQTGRGSIIVCYICYAGRERRLGYFGTFLHLFVKQTGI